MCLAVRGAPLFVLPEDHNLAVVAVELAPLASTRGALGNAFVLTSLTGGLE